MTVKRTAGKSTKKNRRLETCEKAYQRLKRELLHIGFICKGSLNERRLPCGNPKCRCHKDPAKRHGPYYQLSWKENGKTYSRYLSEHEAAWYKTWIQNRQELSATIEKMHATSDRAIAMLLSDDAKRRGKD